MILSAAAFHGVKNTLLGLVPNATFHEEHDSNLLIAGKLLFTSREIHVLVQCFSFMFLLGTLFSHHAFGQSFQKARLESGARLWFTDQKSAWAGVTGACAADAAEKVPL